MIQNNITTSKPLGIRMASGGPLSIPSKINPETNKIADSTIAHFKNVLSYIQSMQQLEVDAQYDGIPGLDNGFASETDKWAGIILPRI
jgi:hypothetical protein